MKEYSIHYGYRIDNLKNGKFYYGIHSTDQVNDGYMGSGVYLKRAYNRAKDDFRKTILAYFDTRSEALSWEASIVTEALVKDRACYNITVGGKGNPTTEVYSRQSIDYKGYGNPELKSWKAFYEDRMDELAWLLIHTNIPDSVLVRAYRDYAPGSNKWKKAIAYLEHLEVLPSKVSQSLVNTNWIISANMDNIATTVKGIVSHYQDPEKELKCVKYIPRLFEGALAEWTRFWAEGKTDSFLSRGYCLGADQTGFDIPAMQKAKALWAYCGMLTNVVEEDVPVEVIGIAGRMKGKRYTKTGKRTTFDVDFKKNQVILLDREFYVYEYDNDEGFVRKGRLVDRVNGSRETL